MTLHAPADAAAKDTAPGAQPGAADQVPHDLFIAGQWQPAAGGTMTVVNPATEDVIAEVAGADVADAERALRAAADAQPGGLLPPPGRDPRPLYRTYQLMAERTTCWPR
jgi:acyl-CoA reductase-like NAD-dependent aldehyde dehydrogenase